MSNSSVSNLKQIARRLGVPYPWVLTPAQLRALVHHKARVGLVGGGPDYAPSAQGWTVFSKEGCGYCKKAKKLLTQRKLPYKTVEVTDDNKEAVYATVDGLTNAYRHYPMIFEDGKFVGGYTEVAARP